MDGPTLKQPRRTIRAGTLRVEVIDGPARGLATLIDADTISVGSAQNNTLEVPDPTLSRFHLELQRTPAGILVTDLESTNGTYVGRVRVERAWIEPEMVIQAGTTSLRIGAGRVADIAVHGEPSLAGLLGDSEVMRRTLAGLERAAAGSSSVLITGESGTGKELTAAALHQLSPRAAAPMIAVDCGAISPSLLASELFGHERGAFTGADSQRIGLFERADGGTIFLDEIGELPPAIQVALLGVLERRRFRRVGGQTEIAVNVRVVAATNRDLRAEVNSGAFRLDLYHRLAVITVRLPPLRERADDIPMLAAHFLRELGETRSPTEVFGADGLAALQRQRWPGNVRELRNVVEATLVVGPGPALGQDARPAADLLELTYKEARAQVTRDFEHQYLTQLLARTQGNVSKASRIAQMDRSHLIELLQRHQIEK